MRNYLKEGKGSYYMCKECSRRVMKTELILVNGVVYHEQCYKRIERQEEKLKSKKSAAMNAEYYALLRKHKGLKGV